MDWGGNWAWVKLLLIPQVMPVKVHFACAHFIVTGGILVAKPPGSELLSYAFVSSKVRLGTSGFSCAARLLSRFCRPELLPGMLSWAHSSQHSPGKGFYTTGEEASHCFVFVLHGHRQQLRLSSLCLLLHCVPRIQQQSRLCVSNGIPGERCLTAELVTTEVAVLSTEYLLALQIFRLVVET